MADAPTTAEEMREAAARACEMVEDAMWATWKARYDPNDQGASLGAGRCSNIIRAIPCAPDPRIAALEAERDRLRAALRIIAGEDQCLDSLMGNADVARAALKGGGNG